jgi:excisionase family DNA binding protein
MTVGEVADRLGIIPRTLFRWMDEGCAPPFYRMTLEQGARWIRFDPAEVEAWIQARRMPRGQQ